MSDSLAVTMVKQRVVEALTDLECLFTEGVELTFVAITPDNMDATLMVTASHRDIIVKAVQHVAPDDACPCGEAIADG